MRNASDPECCHVCSVPAERIYTVPQISPTAKAFEAHFNYGLGKEVHSKRDISEELRRIKGETGKEIVEVGTDNLQSVKTQRKTYSIDQGELDGIKAQLSSQT